MFEQLPATTPHKDRRNFKAFGAAFALQAVLVVVLVIVQMALPEKLGPFDLITAVHMAPPLPPPPAAPVSEAPKQVQHSAPKTAPVRESVQVVPQRPEPVQKAPETMGPTAIPNDIAIIAESSPPSGDVSGGVVGGVQGGVPGGIAGGALDSIFGGAAAPGSPPPPTEPVRIGGNIKEPKP